MAYVYRHIRLDTGLPFYIGIGTDNAFQRSVSIKNRNKYWRNIVNKAGYEVEIIFEGVSNEFACEKEREFILLYGRSTAGGMLVNMTDGGEGVSGMKHSVKSRMQMSESKQGVGKGKIVSPETREKLRVRAMGSKNRVGTKHSEETKRNIGAKSVGRSQSGRKKIADGQK